MDDPATQTKRTPNLTTLIAGGCLTVLYTGLCVLTLVAGGNQITKINGSTATPANTPVPRLLVPPPSGQTRIHHDDFSSNKNSWGLYYDTGKLEIIDGKLVLQSDVPNVIVLGTSRKLAPEGDTYHVQADFSTDTETDQAYGLVFGSNRTLGTYYVFQIWPDRGTYGLYKYNAGKWAELIPATSAALNPYPFSNTLSVDFDSGSIGLYINGEPVSQFTDNDFYQSREIGMFVTSSDYRLLVDDLFLYSEE